MTVGDVVAGRARGDGFGTIPEEPARISAPRVEPARAGVLQPLHACDQVWLGGFKEEMKMIVHQHPGMRSPPGALARRAKRP